MSTEIETLQQHLDALLEHYLEALDSYSKAQQHIQRCLSTAFFELARANASTTIGRRYGQDWYDNRAKASLKASIDPSENSYVTVSTLASTEAFAAKVDADEADSEKGTAGAEKEGYEQVQQPTPPVTPSTSSSSQPSMDEGQPDAAQHKPSKDPLFWFGMLPPRELRQAQASFRQALQTDASSMMEDRPVMPIAAATNAARNMRQLEIEIRRLRKSIRQAARSQQAESS